VALTSDQIIHTGSNGQGNFTMAAACFPEKGGAATSWFEKSLCKKFLSFTCTALVPSKFVLFPTCALFALDILSD
jgi:hypothetical protein